jgi:hypothetical protein
MHAENQSPVYLHVVSRKLNKWLRLKRSRGCADGKGTRDATGELRFMGKACLWDSANASCVEGMLGAARTNRRDDVGLAGLPLAGNPQAVAGAARP